MNESPESQNIVIDPMEEDKKLVGKSMINKNLHPKESNEPEDKDLRETVKDKVYLQQRLESTVKQQVTETVFCEDRDKENTKNGNCGVIIGNEGNFTGKEESSNVEIFKITAEVDNPTGSEIIDTALKIKSFEEEEMKKTLHMLKEEIDSFDCDKSIKYVERVEVKKESEMCDENTLNENSVVKKLFIVKVETSDETEKVEDEVVLTPEETKELTNLILLAENSFCEEVLVKTETEYITISDENVLSPPITDIKSPFYISNSNVPVKFYQDCLACWGWSPTSILYELCCQCNWARPEFRMIEFSNRAGFWCSVKVNDHEFLSYKKARRKAEAKNIASVRFLKFLGFRFSYEAIKNFKHDNPPWSERYAKYNSKALAKEEKRREDCKQSWNLAADVNDLCTYTPKNHRDSKTLTASSSKSRVILKRKQSFDEGLEKKKSRRHDSPELSHRKRTLSPNGSRREKNKNSTLKE